MFHPFGQNSTLPPAAWHPEPPFRGTFEILSSCLITLFLCVWTAVHLNLPEHEKEHLQKWRKLGWLVMGLLAPEVIAWNAWEQRRRMKWLTREMKELHLKRYHTPARKPSTFTENLRCAASTFQAMLHHAWHRIKVAILLEAADIYEPPEKGWEGLDKEQDALALWTDLHSWYALMGGFAFDTTSSKRPFLPNGRKRVTLTAEGVVKLAKSRPNLIPIVSQEDITDKSKSDSLAKLITCWQAAWFCIQCVNRLWQGLAICLLELNVFGHALVTLVIFTIWWGKPKDVREPTKLTGSDADGVAALFATFSPIGHVEWAAPQGLVCGYSAMWIPLKGIVRGRRLPKELAVASYEPRELAYPRSLMIGDRFWMLEPVIHPGWNKIDVWRRIWNARTPPILIDQVTVARLETIRDYEELENFSWRGSNLISPDADSLPKQQSDHVSETLPVLVQGRNGDWTLDEGLSWDLRSLWSTGAMGIACGLYGALHATAWNAVFPTYREHLLWCISSALVAGPFFAMLGWLSFIFVGKGIERIVKMKERRYAERLEAPVLLLALLALGPLLGTCLGIGILYIPCRTYLVVESFISLAHLSEAALRTPTWSQYVPHIT